MWSKTSLFQEGCSKVPAQIQDRNRYSECKWPPPRHAPSLAQSIAIGSWTNDNVETLRSTPCCWSLPENTTIHHGFSSLKKRRKHRQRKKAWIQCSAETWGQGYLFTPVYAMIQNLPKFHVNVSWHLFQDFDILWTSRCSRFPAHLHQHPHIPELRPGSWSPCGSPLDPLIPFALYLKRGWLVKSWCSDMKLQYVQFNTKQIHGTFCHFEKIGLFGLVEFLIFWFNFKIFVDPHPNRTRYLSPLRKSAISKTPCSGTQLISWPRLSSSLDLNISLKKKWKSHQGQDSPASGPACKEEYGRVMNSA